MWKDCSAVQEYVKALLTCLIHLRNPPFIKSIFNCTMRAKRDSAGSKEK